MQIYCPVVKQLKDRRGGVDIWCFSVTHTKDSPAQLQMTHRWNDCARNAPSYDNYRADNAGFLQIGAVKSYVYLFHVNV